MVENPNQVEVASIFSMRRKQYITRSLNSTSAIFSGLELDAEVIVLYAPVVDQSILLVGEYRIV